MAHNVPVVKEIFRGDAGPYRTGTKTKEAEIILILQDKMKIKAVSKSPEKCYIIVRR
jgi:hypothetical protein